MTKYPVPNPNALETKISMAEVEKHTAEGDAWMVIGNLKTQPETGPLVYDVSGYLDDHPGGAEVMLDVAGKDADSMFEDIGHSKGARKVRWGGTGSHSEHAPHHVPPPHTFCRPWKSF